MNLPNVLLFNDYYSLNRTSSPTPKAFDIRIPCAHTPSFAFGGPISPAPGLAVVLTQRETLFYVIAVFRHDNYYVLLDWQTITCSYEDGHVSFHGEAVFSIERAIQQGTQLSLLDTVQVRVISGAEVNVGVKPEKSEIFGDNL